MSKENPERDRAVFVDELQAANNQIPEQMALEVYNVLDTIQVLLAIPKGQRIVVSKTRKAERN